MLFFAMSVVLVVALVGVLIAQAMALRTLVGVVEAHAQDADQRLADAHRYILMGPDTRERYFNEELRKAGGTYAQDEWDRHRRLADEPDDAQIPLSEV